MSILYLDKKTIRLARDGRAVAVYDSEKRTTTIPMLMLERIVIYGDVMLDSNLLYYLAMEGVGVLMLGRGRDKIAMVQGTLGKDAQRRSLQNRLQQDSGWCVAWSKRLIQYKLASQRKLLSRALVRRPDARKPLTDARKHLQSIQLSLQGSADACSLDRLLGMEGAAARAYFSGLAALFPETLNFTHRNRRPPRDPVNACLSLGYTLLHGEAVVACYARGLDPYVGFYHTLAHGRESLAADLVEPLRTRVDLLVWTLIREKRLRKSHFYMDKGACFLGKAGRSVFYQAWECRASWIRRWLRRSMVLVLRGMQRYGDDR